MPSSISSSDVTPHPGLARAREVLGHLGTGWRLVLLALVLTLALGEAYLRLPVVLPRLEFEPDRELDARVAPSQRGFLWLANMSMRTPPITVNREGHRGAEDNWTRPVILVVGDSEWFGAGVEDEEVWPRVLERRLNSPPRRPPVHVVNASQPGYGPYHQSVVIDRLLAHHPVDVLVVRVSIAQWSFRPVPEAERDARMAAAERRAALRRWTRLLPFLANKAEAQLPSIRAAFVPAALRRHRGGDDDLPERMGPIMAAEAAPSWRRLIERAETGGTTVLFVIHEPIPGPSAVVLENALRALTAGHPDAHVTRLGADAFGLDPAAPVLELRRELRARLTVGRDPHANARQHQLIAQAVAGALSALDVPALR
jgi:hypothetical protein